VVPQLGDQPYWANRIAELHIGAAHDGATPTGDSLAAALELALKRETHSRARSIAGSIQSDGATNAAQRLLQTRN
jgi:vancomycin aglycone glucosyltransferase